MIMKYKVARCNMNNNGELTTGKRNEIISWPVSLKINGLYFLRKNKLYKVLEKVE